ncbi:MAG: hypothetical protein ACRC9Q_00725 [Bacteroidales bacterium]
MKTTYRHTQTGFILIVLFSLFTILSSVTILRADAVDFFAFIVPAILLIALLIFARMGVSITDKELRMSFCFGLINKRIDLHRVTFCQIVQPKWYHGVGMHIVSSHTTLYNVSFGKAVEVTLASGSKIWIGSDDCEKLAEVINTSIQ